MSICMVVAHLDFCCTVDGVCRSEHVGSDKLAGFGVVIAWRAHTED